MTNSFKNLKSGFFEMAVTRVLTFATAFLSNIVISRWLGPAGRGEYGIYTTAVMLMAVPFGSGISAANTVIAGQRPQARRQLLMNSMLYAILFVLPLLFLPLLLPQVFEKQISLFSRYWGLVSGGLWLSVSMAAVLGIVLGMQNYGVYNFSSGLLSFLNLAFLYLVLVVFNGDVTGAMISNMAAGFIALLISVVLFFRASIMEPAPLRPNLSLFKETAQIGFRGAFINTLDSLHFRMDILLVGFLLGPASAGLYTQAVTLTAALSFFPPLLNNLIFSHVPSSGKRDARLIVQTAYLMSLITILGLFFVIFAGRFLLVFLFTEEFLPSYLPWVILFIAEIFKSHAAATAGFLAGLGFPQVYLAGSAIGLGVNLGLNFLLIPILGIAGAALASSVSYMTLSAIYLYGMYRHAELETKDLFPSLDLFREVVLPLLRR